MNKILVIGLGGTIGSVKGDSISLDENNLKILDYCKRDDVEFIGVSPFSVLSENMSIELWKSLIDYLNTIDFSKFKGIIILHGSDTLAYTSCLIANAFFDETIVFTAADKPIEDKDSNGISNFNSAVDLIIKGTQGVWVSYNRIIKGNCISSAGCDDRFYSIVSTIAPAQSKIIFDKNILVINPYVGMNFDNYNIDNADCVLISMFHSATVPDSAKTFCNKLKAKNIPYYFVTLKSSADYETAAELENIIFNCTVENAYAKLLLTNQNYVL